MPRGARRWRSPRDGDPRLAKAEDQIAKKCDALLPAAIGPPCDRDALTMDVVTACVLDGHAARVGAMVADEYRDACTILEVLGLAPGLPGVCVGP